MRVMLVGKRDSREQLARLVLIFFTLAVASGAVIFAARPPSGPVLHGVFAITVALFLVMFVRLVKHGASKSIHREPDGDEMAGAEADDRGDGSDR